MTTKQILIKARARIRKGWTQGAFARNAMGKEVSAKDESACQWCLEGAVTAVCTTRAELTKAFQRIYKKFGYTTISWNDEAGRTSKEVLALFSQVMRGLR